MNEKRIEKLENQIIDEQSLHGLFFVLGIVVAVFFIWLLFMLPPKIGMVGTTALDDVCVHLMGEDYKWHNGEFSTDSKFYCKKDTPEITYDNTTLIQRVR